MKTLRRIQNVAVAAALVAVVYLVDSLEPSRRDTISAAVILALVLVVLVSRFMYEEKAGKNKPKDTTRRNLPEKCRRCGVAYHSPVGASLQNPKESSPEQMQSELSEFFAKL